MKKTTRILGILLIAAMLLGALAMTASASAPVTVGPFTVQATDQIATNTSTGQSVNYGTSESTFDRITYTVNDPETITFDYALWLCTVSGADNKHYNTYVTLTNYSCDADINKTFDIEFGGEKEKWTYKIVITKAAGHIYDNGCDTDCNVCGETISRTHSFTNSTCTICGLVCDHADAFDATTGECNTCDEMIAEVSVKLGQGSETFYKTIDEAFGAVSACTAGDAAVVKLYRDITTTTKYDLNGVFALDLNGYTLENTEEHSYVFFVIDDLTIIDSGTGGELKADFGINVSENAKLTVTDGSIVGETYGIMTSNDALVTISGDAEIIAGQYGVSVDAGTTLQVTGGSITAQTAIIYSNPASITISGGTIRGKLADNRAGGSAVQPVITGGSFPEGIQLGIESAYLPTLLGEGYACYVDGVPTAVAADAKSLSGNVTVEPCTHPEAAFNAATGACGICRVMTAQASAKLGENSEVFYNTLKEAFKAVKSCTAENAAVVKLYSDVTTTIPYSLDGVFTLDLNGCTIENTDNNGTLFWVYGDVTVIDSGTGGTLKADYGIVVGENAKLTLTDGSVVGEAYGISTEKDALVTISGDAEILAYQCGVDVSSDAALKVTGGSIIAERAIGYSEPKSVTVSGGIIKGEFRDSLYRGSPVQPVITGGRFPEGIRVYSDGAYLPTLLGAGYAYYVDGMQTAVAADVVSLSGNVTVAPCSHPEALFSETTGECSHCGAFVAVASLSEPDGAHFYRTLAEAVAAAQTEPGSTVMLLADVQLSETLYITAGSFILDLNGHTISNVADAEYPDNALIMNRAALTIVDSSTAKTGKITSNHNTESSMYYCKTIGTTGKLTVMSGTVEHTAGGNAITAEMMGSYGNGSLVVYDGNFVGTVSVNTLAFEIRGGSFDTLTIYANLSGVEPLGKLMGGSMNRIEKGSNRVNLADAMGKDYFYKDSNGKVITPGNSDAIENVTIGKGAHLVNDAAVITVEDATYNGSAQEPEVTVTVGGVTLIKDTDYTVSYANNLNAGTATVTVTGIANYAGVVAKEFTIAPFQLTDANLVSPSLVKYGQTFALGVTVNEKALEVDKDYTVTFDKTPVADAGDYRVTVKGIGNYGGEVSRDFTIVPHDLNEGDITMDITEVLYNGTAQKPQITVAVGGKTLVLDQDYKITWDKEGFVDAGTYTATIQGVGNYQGSFQRTLTIKQAAPVLNATSPVSAAMPGNVIRMSYTLTGVGGEELPNNVVITYAKVGNLDCGINGMDITIPESAVIGDKLVVSLGSLAGGNYAASGEITLEVEIGMPDFTAAIAGLEARVKELEATVATDAELAAEVEELMKEINKLKAADTKTAEDISKINAAIDELEATYATKQELSAAIDALKTGEIAAAQEAINKINGILGTIADGTTVAKELTDLSDAIEALATRVATNEGNIAANTSAVAALQGDLAALQTTVNGLPTMAVTDELSRSITSLTNELNALTGRVTQAEKDIDNLETLIGELRALIQTNADDVDSIEEKIRQINETINKLNDTYATDAELAAAIEAAVSAARQELSTEVQKFLAEAETKLKEALDKKADVVTLDETVKQLQEAIELAKKFATEEDVALKEAIEAADSKLMQAIDKVQENLNETEKELLAAINKVADDLAAAESSLRSSIAASDSYSARKIKELDSALKAAINANAKADAATKEALTALIQQAQETLQQAIDKVASDLETAKLELTEAIATGDKALEEKIAALEIAMNNALAANAAADEELTVLIQSGLAALQQAIDKVASDLETAKQELNDSIASGDKALEDRLAALEKALAQTQKDLNETEKNLDDTKTELTAKDEQMRKHDIASTTVASVGVAGNITLLVWLLLKSRKLL